MEELDISLWIDAEDGKAFIDALEKLCEEHSENRISYHFKFK